MLYAAVSEKNSDRFSLCRYDMELDKWQTDTGRVRLPSTEEGIPICCGFAISAYNEYFYLVDKGFVSVSIYDKDFVGWESGNAYINAPENTELLSGGMIFRVDRFYIAMLCADKGDREKKNVYLYDCSDGSEDGVMREIIHCSEATRDDLFYPVSSDGQRAWFGSDENNVFGIFPDKNLWVYTTFD